MKSIITFDRGCYFLDQGISKLKEILEGDAETQFSSEEVTKLYTLIYIMCTQKPPHDYSQKLYDKYREIFEEYISSEVLPSLRNKDGECMLREFVRRWTNHKIMVQWLSMFFLYLDRFFISRRSLTPLRKVGQKCFKDLVYQELNEEVKDGVLYLIDDEREGKQIDRALLKKIVDIFVEIGIGEMSEMTYYENDFEESMLVDSANYYSGKASTWIVDASCPDYMFKAEECLKQEKDRAAHYLHPSSEKKLLEKVHHKLMSKYATQLLEMEHSGCHALLRDGKVEDLSRMFRLFSKTPQGLVSVSHVFKLHITAEGSALVKQAEVSASDKKVYARKVLELHEKFLAYVNDCFQNHKLFHKALMVAFDLICNKDVAGSSSAELLATFCDNILKKGGSEKLSDEAIEGTLEKVTKLLVYISNKDLFGEFCRRKLSSRLLFDKSANDEHEISFLTKLKKQFGFNFTPHMEGMLSDMARVKENQSSFEEYLSHNPNAITGIDFSVTVLATNFWPPYKTIDLNLPPDMAKCFQVFREFYQPKIKRQKLTLIHSLGTCTINGYFDQQTVELILTTHQAAVLLLFNTSDKLSLQEIANQLNLPEKEVIKLLHSLSCTKYKILNKEPKNNLVSPTDTFEYNSKFSHKMKRIKIPLTPVDEKKKVIEVVDERRSCAIWASIVRIMKSRKVLSYRQLFSESDRQLNHLFKLDDKAMKKSVENLIYLGYLERDEDNLNMLKYLEG